VTQIVTIIIGSSAEPFSLIPGQFIDRPRCLLLLFACILSHIFYSEEQLFYALSHTRWIFCVLTCGVMHFIQEISFFTVFFRAFVPWASLFLTLASLLSVSGGSRKSITYASEAIIVFYVFPLFPFAIYLVAFGSLLLFMDQSHGCWIKYFLLHLYIARSRIKWFLLLFRMTC